MKIRIFLCCFFVLISLLIMEQGREALTTQYHHQVEVESKQEAVERRGSLDSLEKVISAKLLAYVCECVCLCVLVLGKKAKWNVPCAEIEKKNGRAVEKSEHSALMASL